MFMISFIKSERKLHFSFLWKFPIKIVTIITDKLPSLFEICLRHSDFLENAVLGNYLRYPSKWLL